MPDEVMICYDESGCSAGAGFVLYKEEERPAAIVPEHRRTAFSGLGLAARLRTGFAALRRAVV